MCMGRPTAQGKWKKSYCPHWCMGIHVKERKSIFPFPESCQIVLESERKAEFFGKGGKERFLIPFLFSFNRLKKPWHYKFSEGKDLYICKGQIKSSQHQKYVRAVPLCLFSVSFLKLLFCQKNGKWERFLKFYSKLWKEKEMERNAVQFRYCEKERESFPVVTGRKGKEMLSEKNGQVNMYEIFTPLRQNSYLIVSIFTWLSYTMFYCHGHKPPPCSGEQNLVLCGPMRSYPNFFSG